MITPLLKPKRKKQRKAEKHNEACRKFREWYAEQNGGYTPCQICDRTDQPIYDPCHIYDGKWSHHPAYNTFQNMFMGCRKCHLRFDRHLLPQWFQKFEEERGLKQLFN